VTVAEQLSLLGTSTAALQVVPERPRCHMCAHPAWWLKKTQKWGLYCGSTGCVSRERLCQRCGSPFALGISGAGTKYCSLECRVARCHSARVLVVALPCAWCGRRPADNRGFAGQKWPYICAECLHPIRHVVPRLKDHSVPHEMARRLLTDSACEICGTDMLERRRQSNGKVAATLVVDHDHECCPVEQRSCGKCVRGLICRTCNVAAGLLYDDAQRARSLADYLDRTREPHPVTSRAGHPARLAEETS
jgi:hypothetical protein